MFYIFMGTKFETFAMTAFENRVVADCFPGFGPPLEKRQRRFLLAKDKG